MLPNVQETVDLVTFAEEILNGKLHFFSVSRAVHKRFFDIFRGYRIKKIFHSRYFFLWIFTKYFKIPILYNIWVKSWEIICSVREMMMMVMMIIIDKELLLFNGWPKKYVKPFFQSGHKKIKFSIKDFFSKSHQIRIFLRLWSDLLKKSLMESFIFCA